MIIKKQKSVKNQLLIFDFDGTLADTFRAHYEAWLEVLETYDTRTSSLLRSLLREGLDSEKIARNLGIKEKLIPMIADKKQKVFFKIALEKANLYPYAKQVIKTLYKRGYILCVLTTVERKTVERILLKYNLKKYFSFIVGREDVKYPKPHPQTIYLVFKRLEETLGKEADKEIFYIGDSKTDFALSRVAGTPFILFLSPYQGKQKYLVEKDDECVVTINSLKELLNIFPPLGGKDECRD
jgi:phosphoglycolate phosphatase